MNYKVKKLSDLNDEHIHQVSKIFIDSFYYMFEKFCKEIDSIRVCFEKAFIPSMFYVALDNNKVVGFIGISNNKKRVVDFEKSMFIEKFGDIKGKYFYWQLKKLIGVPIVKNENECYIDFVAVDKEYRNRGVGTTLFKYIHYNKRYKSYSLDVLSKNEGAKKLYESLGYKTTHIKKSFVTNISGLGHFIIMQKNLR